MTKITAVVLAAGQGKRMNSSVAKQYLTLRGKPILYYALNAFEQSSVDEIILVAGTGQVEYCDENIVKKYGFQKVTQIIEGGAERYDSVYRALSAIGQTDYVLIHDGARPFISPELIEAIIKEVMEQKACILGTPVKETIKVADSKGFITSTPDRSSLWAAQTPQAFEFRSIMKAYDRMYQDLDCANITDDAMVYEAYLRKPVKIMLGDYHNLKITTPEDLILAEAMAKELL